MLEVLEKPAFVPPFTNPEKAREAAYKSHEAQAQLKEDGLRFRELALEQAKAPPKPIEQTEAVQEAQRQITLANQLLTYAHAELEAMKQDTYGFCPECKRHGGDAKEQAALLREIRGLMEHLCRLHNIAQAPTSRVNPKPQRRPEPMPEPTPAVPTPTVTPSTPAAPGAG